MSDLHEPKAAILLARLDLQIDEQRLVLEQKELRLVELDEEQANVQKDIERVDALRSDTLATAAKVKDGASAEARRLNVTAHEHALQVKGKRIRLLELDEERQQIATDKEASLAHITKLEAEVRQQQDRLKESKNG